MGDDVGWSQTNLSIDLKKIYKLKQWYSIQDAAERLSLTLEEEVSSAAVLELALDGHICLHWFMRHVSTREVVYQTRSLPLSFDKENKPILPSGGEGKTVNVEFKDFFPLEGRKSISILDGPHRLRLELCGALEDYLRAHLTNTGGELVSLDGFFVESDDGHVFQVMESFDSVSIKSMFPDDRLSMHDVRGYYPSGDWPALSELGFTKQELERFEGTLQDSGPKEVASRERQTLYKMLIAMALDGYGYDHAASRSPFPTELEGILERLGLPVSDDTIRQKLKEAAELLGRDVEK
ncbi:hypothetical protein K3727_04005 [Rhodobacteraceae bacterium M382]|nr:hypothetical protein K3727_04005 [Rhodobacteraceae bacterium M382]